MNAKGLGSYIYGLKSSVEQACEQLLTHRYHEAVVHIRNEVSVLNVKICMALSQTTLCLCITALKLAFHPNDHRQLATPACCSGYYKLKHMSISRNGEH